MTPDQGSHVASRQSVERSEDVGKRRTARSLCAKSASAILAAAFVVATAQFAMGCAEQVEREPEQSVEPKSGIRTVQPKPPSQDPPLDGPEFRLQKKRDWWNQTQKLLFIDIELSAEQAHALDEIIEVQLNRRALLQQFDANLKAARETQDSKRINAAHAEFRALQQQLAKPHEIYEEMRAVLAEEQRPAFDMNRARHVAETQRSKRIRPEQRAGQAEQE
jgi:hypothetical protein